MMTEQPTTADPPIDDTSQEEEDEEDVWDDEDQDDWERYSEDDAAWNPEGGSPPNQAQWVGLHQDQWVYLLYLDPKDGQVLDRGSFAEVWKHGEVGMEYEQVSPDFNSEAASWCKGLELSELLPDETPPPLGTVGHFGRLGFVLCHESEGQSDSMAEVYLEPYDEGGMEAFVGELEAGGEVRFRHWPHPVDYGRFVEAFLYAPDANPWDDEAPEADGHDEISGDNRDGEEDRDADDLSRTERTPLAWGKAHAEHIRNNHAATRE